MQNYTNECKLFSSTKGCSNVDSGLEPCIVFHKVDCVCGGQSLHKDIIHMVTFTLVYCKL